MGWAVDGKRGQEDSSTREREMMVGVVKDERRKTGELYPLFIHFRPELTPRKRSVQVT